MTFDSIKKSLAFAAINDETDQMRIVAIAVIEAIELATVSLGEPETEEVTRLDDWPETAPEGEWVYHFVFDDGRRGESSPGRFIDGPSSTLYPNGRIEEFEPSEYFTKI